MQQDFLSNPKAAAAAILNIFDTFFPFKAEHSAK
jgi:hypothetical protein